jgi:hypothetical protein
MSREQIVRFVKGDGHVDDDDWVHGGNDQVGA